MSPCQRMHLHSEVKTQAEPPISSFFFLNALQQRPPGVAASHSSITGRHPAHTFPSLPGIRPVTPVRISRYVACSSGEATAYKRWTVAVSHCLCAWQRSSQPPLCSHQEMSFSNSFSNALNSSLLSSNKAKSKKSFIAGDC